MSFPASFLDELRARVSLAGIIGRRVRLTKRGREFIGLCPFHKEKTPSFNVVEDKGFFHCFGCGAHGDVIGFVMQTGNLGFREAIEQLASEAGLEVPHETPQERAHAERHHDLQDALEAAARFFAEQLAAPAGRAGLAYLRQRGLDDAAIDRFRLGFAPESRDALKRALGGTFAESLLLACGLLRQPEGGGASYDYFRNRVIFPIGDRAGRIIAFGGRVIGEDKPKYLNSPETAVFQKGRTLYGWAAAREAAAREPSVIVTEGYMDVIALHRAGFPTAVAPLGTALTEMQIEELWKIAPEPILCFDGDAAGVRAALRAAERALPMLRPGFTLRFAALPEGEDPDTLIAHQGSEAMRELLRSAQPLSEMLWSAERNLQAADTPERRAALKQRLDQRVESIADRNVAGNYRQFFEEKLYREFRGRRSARSAPRGKPAGRWRDQGQVDLQPPRGPSDPGRLFDRRQQEILVATILLHPALLDSLAEDFADLELTVGDLDKLRRGILNLFALRPDLDAEALTLHLCHSGLNRIVDGLLTPQVYNHAKFARSDADLDEARHGWVHARNTLYRRRQLAAEIDRAKQSLASEMTEASWAQLRALQEQWEEAGSADLSATGGS